MDQPMDELVAELIEEHILRTPRIINAFRAINREDFVPPEMKGFAHINEALPIGHGQTISQPGVVALMLELLEPAPGEAILDIGAGSGWTTALLAHIAGESEESDSGNARSGKVIGIERIPELAVFGKENIAKYNFITKGLAEFHCANGAEGYAPEAPFDKILISASLPSKEIPFPMKEQLKTDGIIVAPIRESIWRIQKKNDDEFAAQEYPGFLFVPFIPPAMSDD